MSELNDGVIAEFRANRGVVKEAMGGHFKDVHLLLLHNTGKRTGRALVNPLLYIADGDNYVIAGSNGGAADVPLWVANVEAMGETTIEVGERTLAVRPTVVRSGPEWERLYKAFVEYWPDMLEYETHTDRAFALVVLEPTSAAG
jgi:deazaflavin-dependent oxidoreductase (nitroreductase family)